MAIKKEDLKSLSADDLKQRLVDDRTTLQKLIFNHTVNPLDNPMQIRFMRREIARINSELRFRELKSAK